LVADAVQPRRCFSQPANEAQQARVNAVGRRPHRQGPVSLSNAGFRDSQPKQQPLEESDRFHPDAKNFDTGAERNRSRGSTFFFCLTY
jgi:hypothetical protein